MFPLSCLFIYLLIISSGYPKCLCSKAHLYIDEGTWIEETYSTQAIKVVRIGLLSLLCLVFKASGLHEGDTDPLRAIKSVAAMDGDCFRPFDM